MSGHSRDVAGTAAEPTIVLLHPAGAAQAQAPVPFDASDGQDDAYDRIMADEVRQVGLNRTVHSSDGYAVGRILDARFIEPGQPVEVTFKAFPREVHAGRVPAVLQAIATGQAQPGGLAVAPSEIRPAPFVVRLTLDDPAVSARLPAGSTDTERVQAAHVIRKVALRQAAILNYVNPFWGAS